MSIAERLATLEATLAQLHTEFIEIAATVEQLEAENERLRAQLSPEALSEAQGLGGGQQALAKLYEEGFHICPEYYGRLHDENGCLFCQEVLRHVTN